MAKSYDRQTGKRAKLWALEGDVTRLIEGTGEYPIMYRNLGTEPQKKHPFNLYGDIKSQPEALKDTFELNMKLIPDIAARLVNRGYDSVIGHGLGTSQFVAQTASAAFREYAGWEAKDLDSLEYVNYGYPIDF
ncbi:MAG: hypothetical protein AB1798_18365, partial [Spirochaetota bacterium]